MGRPKAREGLGQVETPPRVARRMAELLLDGAQVGEGTRILDAGCGRGALAQAVLSLARERGLPAPRVVCVEIDPRLAAEARRRFAGIPGVEVVEADLLSLSQRELGAFDLVISNPPYVPYEAIDPALRARYAASFSVARGRFDLYFLFFEKALELLRPGGRLVFVTTEKYAYTLSASALRRLLARHYVRYLEFLPEDAFPGVLAYPLITVVEKRPPEGPALARLRDGRAVSVRLPADGSPWLPAILQAAEARAPPAPGGRYVPLERLALRVSAGVETGRDDAFVVPRRLLPPELEPFAYPTVSGRDLAAFRPGEVVDPSRLPNVMLVPYRRDGRLMGEDEARPLLEYLARRRAELEARYAVKAKGKPWYAFHEDPPMEYLLRPKILFPDVAREPAFYVDATGSIIPGHSVYYIVPKDPGALFELARYLNSEEAREFLRRSCQRAADGYLRLQSHVVKRLPVPERLPGLAARPNYVVREERQVAGIAPDEGGNARRVPRVRLQA